ncbi:hypothetical protein ACWEGQ_34335, partial [Streptomyces seoulensis]
MLTSSEVPLPPASGAWREGDPPGRRRWYERAAPLALKWDAECGDRRCDERTNVDTGQPCISCGEKS